MTKHPLFILRSSVRRLTEGKPKNYDYARMSETLSEEEEEQQPWNFHHHSQPPTAHPKTMFGLTSICVISHFQFFSNFKECAFVIRRLVTASQRLLVPNSLQAHYDAWQFFLDKKGPVNLKDHPRGARSMMRKILLVDEWIERLLASPVPQEGETCLELELFPSDQVDQPPPPLMFALPDRDRLSLCDFPLHLPLELLGVSRCLQVIPFSSRGLQIQLHELTFAFRS